MPKINHEEYEVLKESQEKGYLLIARMKEGHLIRFREHRGKSEQRWLVTTNKEDSKYGSVHNPNDLFQFIQWSDSEPYSIAELIEEYECSAEHVSHVVNERVKALGKAWSESEETEVKNIEWLKEEVNKTLHNKVADGINYYDYLDLRKSLYELINQLDEPEVVTEEWIDNHTASAYTIAHYSEEDVHVIMVSDLRNLLVPEQEITEEQVQKYLSEHGIEVVEKELETVASVFVDYLQTAAGLKQILGMEAEVKDNEQKD